MSRRPSKAHLEAPIPSLEDAMNRILCASVAILALTGGIATAQTATETTTSQSTTAPVVAAPPADTLTKTQETHAVDAYGNRSDSKASSMQDSQGNSQDTKTTTNTSMPAPPPPPPATTTTSTDTTTSGPH
jgi:hypothetical protein